MSSYGSVLSRIQIVPMQSAVKQLRSFPICSLFACGFRLAPRQSASYISARVCDVHGYGFYVLYCCRSLRLIYLDCCACYTCNIKVKSLISRVRTDTKRIHCMFLYKEKYQAKKKNSHHVCDCWDDELFFYDSFGRNMALDGSNVIAGPLLDLLA